MIRKNDNVIHGTFICDKSIDVPEIPLSYKLTGIKNTVTPNALIMPAIVSIIIFVICRLVKAFFI